MKSRIIVCGLLAMFLASCGKFNINVQVQGENPSAGRDLQPTSTLRTDSNPTSTAILTPEIFTPSIQSQKSSFKLMDFVVVCPAVGEICIGYVWIQNTGSLYPTSRRLEPMRRPAYDICFFEGNEACLGMLQDTWIGDFTQDMDYNLSWDTSEVWLAPKYTSLGEFRIPHAGVYKFSLFVFDEYPSSDTTRKNGPEIASRIVLVTVK
jgi:hypothetical protein